MAEPYELVTAEHIRHSNLIEGIDDPAADETHMEAWCYLAAVDVLTLEAILECHRIITADSLGDDAGRLRQVNVRVGGRVCNGRTGRCLYWWHQVKLGQEPTLIRVEGRHEYYGWFRTAEGQLAALLREAQRWIEGSRDA